MQRAFIIGVITFALTGFFLAAHQLWLGTLFAQSVARIGQPASVPVAVERRSEGASTARLVIEVLEYRPPMSGTVQFAVRYSAPGGISDQYVGNFSIFPDQSFDAATPEHAKRFDFPLRQWSMSESNAGIVTVEITPEGGGGKGAVLVIGKAVVLVTD